ncbi:hypothetical protein EZS27_003452 [termite gut metagenome]|uniref:Uncharacterized protein n=1 Tax=termite gut metagenome TaxID=433724 RepID=A0A5J4SSI4_9ZZZZ
MGKNKKKVRRKKEVQQGERAVKIVFISLVIVGILSIVLYSILS